MWRKSGARSGGTREGVPFTAKTVHGWKASRAWRTGSRSLPECADSLSSLPLDPSAKALFLVYFCLNVSLP